MPSVRVLVRPDVLKDIPEPVKQRLSLMLRETVASSFGFGVEDVEAVWIPVEYAENFAALNIEVLFSVSRKFDPVKAVREGLAQTLVDMVSSLPWLPLSVANVSSWVRPQRGAIFKMADRVSETK